MLLKLGMVRNILVTGSSGMIGTRLCEKLIKRKFNITGVDWKHNRWNPEIDKLTINIDLRDSAKLCQVPRDIDLIIHLAANARVYKLVVNPIQARDNFEILYNILEFSRKNNIKRIIFSSSREVYGSSGNPVRQENDVRVQNCESPYAATKIANEAMIWAYHHCYGIDFIIFRFSNVYGMYDDSDRVIPQFIKLASLNRDLIVYGKDKLIDLTYIDDTIEGIVKGIQGFNRSKNQVYNIANSKGVPLIDLAKMIIARLNSTSKIIVMENRIGEIMRYISNISKSKAILGYSPSISVEEGINKSIQWYLNTVEQKHTPLGKI